MSARLSRAREVAFISPRVARNRAGNYIGPADCPVDDHGRCTNALGSKTHDILIIHGGADDSIYDHCTFRRAHDGRQLAGHRIEVAHSLFVVTQGAAHVPGRPYRLTAWLCTDGATQPATLAVRWRDAAGRNLGALAIPLGLSERHYTLIDRTLTGADLPAATAALELEVRYEPDLPGTIRSDDVLLEARP